jgi:hypothetical protein
MRVLLASYESLGCPPCKRTCTRTRVTIIFVTPMHMGFLEAMANQPEPLSPVFQAGGVLEGYNEDVVQTVAFLAFLFVLDRLVAMPFIHPGARYFFLHAVINLGVVCFAAWPDVLRLLLDSTHAYSGPSHTMVANSAIMAIHIYHCLAFKLSTADIVHHLLFVTICCGLAIPFKHHGGVANNVGCFVLSGLPGGVDYVMLVLVKHSKLDKLTEKKWNARIQGWLRGPPMAVYAFVVWQNYCLGTLGAKDLPYQLLFFTTAATLHILNGVYYGVYLPVFCHWERSRQLVCCPVRSVSSRMACQTAALLLVLVSVLLFFPTERASSLPAQCASGGLRLCDSAQNQSSVS